MSSVDFRDDDFALFCQKIGLALDMRHLGISVFTIDFYGIWKHQFYGRIESNSFMKKLSLVSFADPLVIINITFTSAIVYEKNFCIFINNNTGNDILLIFPTAESCEDFTDFAIIDKIPTNLQPEGFDHPFHEHLFFYKVILPLTKQFLEDPRMLEAWKCHLVFMIKTCSYRKRRTYINHLKEHLLYHCFLPELLGADVFQLIGTTNVVFDDDDDDDDEVIKKLEAIVGDDVQSDDSEEYVPENNSEPGPAAKRSRTISSEDQTSKIALPSSKKNSTKKPLTSRKHQKSASEIMATMESNVTAFFAQFVPAKKQVIVDPTVTKEVLTHNPRAKICFDKLAEAIKLSNMAKDIEAVDVFVDGSMEIEKAKNDVKLQMCGKNL